MSRPSDSSPTRLRDCAAGDLPAVTAIYAEAVRHGRASFELEPPDLAEMTRRRDALVAGGFPYLVAEIDGTIAGYAYAGPYRSRPAYAWTVENSVYVAPPMQGRGLGLALLTRLIDAATAHGFRQMIAVIGDSANHASIRLHTRAGFAPVGVLRASGFKHGVWLDSVLMQRALGDGDRTPPAVPAAPTAR
ncbi:GNAT family N-acetyltransferase [Rhodoplanes azumiensis]|uniref:GNAT family N-acetyltransferase n=1 Tax=Rhodoplanes azumiensis TaxID=1897628 RepID=A0ABW5AK98_9BRAD